MAGAFITMVASPIAQRQNFLNGYMSDMQIDFTDDYLMGTSLMFATVTQNENNQQTLKLFYFSDTMPDINDENSFYLHPDTHESLVMEVGEDYPSLLNQQVEINIALMTGPDKIEPISLRRILKKANSAEQSFVKHIFHKLLKTDVSADELNKHVNIENPELIPGESIEHHFLMQMRQLLVIKLWEKFTLDRHDDATYRFFLGTLNNWAECLNLFVDVKMEDYYSTEHAAIRHVTTNFEIYLGRIMERFGVPLVMLIRHTDRKIPDYEKLGGFIRSLGPDAPYQVITESDIYRFFDIEPEFEEGGREADYPNPIGLKAEFNNNRKYFPELANKLFSQRMLDCYPRDQQRIVLMEARKALNRGDSMENFVAHFLGLMMSESEDGRSFYLILENAFISAQKVHLFLIRGWDPSAIIAISEGRVDYVRLINILIEHCTEFKLPLQFTLTTIDKSTKGVRPADFRESIGNHFTVSTANEWFDWSSRPDFSKFMNTVDARKKFSVHEPNIKRKVAGSMSNVDKLFVDATDRKEAIIAKKKVDGDFHQYVRDIFDPNVDTDDLVESYYGSQYSLQSEHLENHNGTGTGACFGVRSCNI